MSTARRLKETGAPGIATAVQVVPPSAERNTPSLHPASISAVATGPGAIATDHVAGERRRIQVTPPSEETKRPLLVAATRRWPSDGLTFRSKKPTPMKGEVASVDQVVPPSVERRTPAPSQDHQFPSPVPQYTLLGLEGS